VHNYLTEGRHFAVNILSEEQEHLSRRFASKDQDRFGGAGYSYGASGAPLLEGALAAIECRIVHTYPGGDHTIVVGEVESTSVAEHKPLAYYRGHYAQIT
jgi:3-hydroxy-9,10-secoandrosta-1,3,5(10)-triene-9,17-dione monooxygenase reductase component